MGILTNGSILATQAHSSLPSTVLRGKLVRENVLCDIIRAAAARCAAAAERRCRRRRRHDDDARPLRGARAPSRGASTATSSWTPSASASSTSTRPAPGKRPTRTESRRRTSWRQPHVHGDRPDVPAHRRERPGQPMNQGELTATSRADRPGDPARRGDADEAVLRAAGAPLRAQPHRDAPTTPARRSSLTAVHAASSTSRSSSSPSSPATPSGTDPPCRRERLPMNREALSRRRFLKLVGATALTSPFLRVPLAPATPVPATRRHPVYLVLLFTSCGVVRYNWGAQGPSPAEPTAAVTPAPSSSARPSLSSPKTATRSHAVGHRAGRAAQRGGEGSHEAGMASLWTGQTSTGNQATSPSIDQAIAPLLALPAQHQPAVPEHRALRPEQPGLPGARRRHADALRHDRQLRRPDSRSRDGPHDALPDARAGP